MIPFKLVCYTLSKAVLCSSVLILIGVAFQSTLRFSKRKTICIMTIGYGIGMVVDLLILEAGAPFHFYYIQGTVFIALVDLIFAIVIFKKDPLQIFFSVFMILTINDNLMVVATRFDALHLLPNFMADFPQLNHIVYMMIAFLLIFPLLIYLFCKLLRQMVEIGIDMHLWRALFLLPFFNYITGLINDTYWAEQQLGTVQGFVSALVRCLLTIGCYVVALKMLLYAYEKAISGYRIQVAEQQVGLERERYITLAEHIEQTARLHHDWRHHMLAFRAFIDQGDLSGLSDYLCQIDETYRVNDEQPICSRLAVDAMLRHYLAQAVQQGIEVEHRINIPETFERSDLDLCIIFGNLTENALEACVRQKEGRRFISVTVDSISDNVLALRIKNSFDGTVTKQGGDYLSTKRKGLGVGLASVKSIATERGGKFRVSAVDSVFTVEILLKA